MSSTETEIRSLLAPLRAEVRSFLAGQLEERAFTPQVNGWLTGWDEDFSRLLAGRGWVGMTIPRNYGGSGMGFLERFVVTEELLAAGAPVAAHWIADRQIAPSLLRYGTPEQKEYFLPRIARGEEYFAIGMSEPDSGSDLASVRTKAVEASGGWEISGAKVWTSGAHRAHHFIVLTRTSSFDESRHDGLSQFIVSLDAPGVDIRPIVSADGRHHFNEVFLDSVVVPTNRVFGEIGDGWKQVTSELGFERSGPERFLSTFPVLSGLAAEKSEDAGRLVARAAALHGLSYEIAQRLSDGHHVDHEAAMVKVMGTEFEGEVAEAAALGVGDGGATGLVNQALLDRPGFTLRGGTNEIMRGVIARGLGLR